MEQIRALNGTVMANHAELTGLITTLTSDTQTANTTLTGAITTLTNDTQPAMVAVTNRMEIMEHFNVPAGFAGVHSRLEALESAGIIASNWKEFMSEEIVFASRFPPRPIGALRL